MIIENYIQRVGRNEKKKKKKEGGYKYPYIFQAY